MSAPSNSGVSAPGLDQGSPATTFQVEELTGPKRRIVNLNDRALPYRGIKFTGKMRCETTWYPGNPVATQQVTGSDETETTVGGMWKDRFIGGGNADFPPVIVSGEPVNSVFDVVALFDDIRRQGQQLRVTWGQLIRVGVMTEFSHEWVYPTDVKWSATFAWASQGEDNPGLAPPEPSVGDAQAQARAATDNAAGALNGLGVFNLPAQTPVNPFSAASDALDAISEVVSSGIAASAEFVAEVNGRIQAAYSAVDALADLSGQAADVLIAAADAALRAASLFAYIALQFGTVEDDIDARAMSSYFHTALPGAAGPGGLTPLGGHGALPVDSIPAGKLTLAESNARQSRKAARDARYQAARQQAAFAAQAQPAEMLAVFVARGDQDLRRVAVQFYGRQEPWRDLAAYNLLSGSRLSAGQLVFVPKAPPAATAQGIPQIPNQPAPSQGRGQAR